MAASFENPDSRALALAWLLRPSSDGNDDSDALDLETLDQWRQGALPAHRAAAVKRQLSHDPRMMRMLEELMTADDLLEDWEPEESAAAVGQATGIGVKLKRLSITVRDTLNQFDLRWGGAGLAVAAAGVIAVAILIPVFPEADFDQQLEGMLAAVEEPPDQILTWGPRIAIRGSGSTESATRYDSLQQLTKRAFANGIADGVGQLRARYPGWAALYSFETIDLSANCGQDDALCAKTIDLARISGTWAFVAYLQCRTPPQIQAQVPQAFAMLPSLTADWVRLDDSNPMAQQLKDLAANENPCFALDSFLKRWGR